MPGSRFIKFKKNEIGASCSFWELNGDELRCFNEARVRKGALKVRYRCVKVSKGALKVG